MDLYLPVANLSVNALVIILLGGGVGFLSVSYTHLRAHETRGNRG